MLIKPISVVLLFSLLSANLSSVLVFAGFKFNQSYIAKELCENRDKPVMKCEGKCYLMKKLKQAEEKEQQQDRQMAQKLPMQEALVGVEVLKFQRYAFAKILFHVPLCTGVPSSSQISIFHPPRA